MINEYFIESSDVLNAMVHDSILQAAVGKAAKTCITALQAGNKILLAGNGGSAADAQHWAAELVSRFNYDRPGLAAIALTTDTSALTAIGNDYGYEKVFSRQIEALAKPSDVLLAISTSGHSKNILHAVAAAQAAGMFVVGFTGSKDSPMSMMCDQIIRIPSEVTSHIQEGHAVCGHVICSIIEQTMFPR